EVFKAGSEARRATGKAANHTAIEHPAIECANQQRSSSVNTATGAAASCEVATGSGTTTEEAIGPWFV
ncbi:MAG TPA: hypothetical protein VIH67_14045, partial [Candidatus Acidoferrum sp.]